MPGLTAVVFAAALAGPMMLGSEPPGGSGEANTISPLDVPSNRFNRIEMVRPDRDPETTICRYESQPDSHFKKRSCVHRRDRQALETLEHEHLMVSQRAFCVGGGGC
jgi:hypothetical protein